MNLLLPEVIALEWYVYYIYVIDIYIDDGRRYIFDFKLIYSNPLSL